MRDTPSWLTLSQSQPRQDVIVYRKVSGKAFWQDLKASDKLYREKDEYELSKLGFARRGHDYDTNGVTYRRTD
jgi:hypothetical protein